MSSVFRLSPLSPAAANMLPWKPGAAQTSENGIERGWDKELVLKRHCVCIIEPQMITVIAKTYFLQHGFIRFCCRHIIHPDESLSVWKCFLIHHFPCHPPCHGHIPPSCSSLLVHLMLTDLTTPSLLLCLCSVFISPFFSQSHSGGCSIVHLGKTSFVKKGQIDVP